MGDGFAFRTGERDSVEDGLVDHVEDKERNDGDHGLEDYWWGGVH
jgi:hypothetical protein